MLNGFWSRKGREGRGLNITSGLQLAYPESACLLISMYMCIHRQFRDRRGGILVSRHSYDLTGSEDVTHVQVGLGEMRRLGDLSGSASLHASCKPAAPQAERFPIRTEHMLQEYKRLFSRKVELLSTVFRRPRASQHDLLDISQGSIQPVIAMAVFTPGAQGTQIIHGGAVLLSTRTWLSNRIAPALWYHRLVSSLLV